MRFFPLLLLALLFFLPGCGQQRPAPPPEESPPAKESIPEQEPKPLPAPDPAPTPEPLPEDFVLVTDYIPGIWVDLRYAAEDNFTGQAIYDFTGAYLRYGTVQRLAAAQEALSARGYSLLIWDAFRPAQAQFRLWEACPNPVYVANPEKGFSSHSRGNTVDVTLIGPDGASLEMPTEFDDFSSLADRDYSDVPESAAANARLLEDVMADCGFRPYAGEWWHFSDSDSYPVEQEFYPEE